MIALFISPQLILIESLDLVIYNNVDNCTNAKKNMGYIADNQGRI